MIALLDSNITRRFALTMRQPTHKDLVKAIKSLITEHGGFVYKHYSGGPMGLNGVADLIGVHRGRGVAIEVKTGRDKLSEKQAKFLESWRHRDRGQGR